MRGHAMSWLVLIVLVAGSAAGAPTDHRVVAKYNDTWGQQVKEADTTKKRLALVRQMIEAAVNTDDKELRLYTFDKAFFLGLRDYPQGHRLAAQAVQLIQETDTAMRMDCLERLDRLYSAGWHIDRRGHLGAGIEAAEVKVEMGQRRLLQLFRSHRKEGLEKIEFIGELNKVKKDYIEAYTITNQVLRTAETFGRNHRDKKVRESLTKFANENGPLLGKIKQAQTEVLELYNAYRRHGDAALPPHQRPGAEDPVAIASTEQPRRDTRPKPEPAKTTTLPDRDGPKLPGRTVESKPVESKPVESKPRRTRPTPADDKVVENAFTKAIKAGHWREKKCVKCKEAFVPAFGDKTDKCYWCKKGTSIFGSVN